MSREAAEKLLRFIDRSPTSFHVIANMAEELKGAGYEQLYEEERWNLKTGGKYFVTRNGSSILTFNLPKKYARGFLLMASHSDSPTFKVKENPELEVDHQFVKLNVEKYGGMLMAPWFDRPLSLAGRLLIQEGEAITTCLVNVDRDLVLIPSLAIHMNRNANEGVAYNPQVDLQPLFGGSATRGSFRKILAASAGVRPEDILGMDIFLYNRMKGTIWGANGEFLSSGRLDDLQCAYGSLQGFLNADNPEHVIMHCVLDNEEVGSLTRQGAASTFLKDVLERISESIYQSREEYLRALASSFMISADNAHSVHPNQAEKSDRSNRPYLNGGIVLKHSANQKYTTDGASAAVFRALCRKAGVSCQNFTNRSDMVGGSTLGNLSNGQVSIHTVDIGLPQLAMHSPYETGGVRDMEDLIKVAETFYCSKLKICRDGVYCIEP